MTSLWKLCFLFRYKQSLALWWASGIVPRWWPLNLCCHLTQGLEWARESASQITSLTPTQILPLLQIMKSYRTGFREESKRDPALWSQTWVWPHPVLSVVDPGLWTGCTGWWGEGASVKEEIISLIIYGWAWLYARYASIQEGLLSNGYGFKNLVGVGKRYYERHYGRGFCRGTRMGTLPPKDAKASLLYF